MTPRKLILFSTVLLASCATADQVHELEERISALEQAVADGAGADSEALQKESEARALYSEIKELLEAFKMEEARDKMKIMVSRYADTETYNRNRVSKLAGELEVIGRAAPETFEVDKWFQGDENINLSNGTTLLVFWEKWCPHCQREVPEVQATFDDLGPQGLTVVGLTKLSRDTSEESVIEFIAEQEVTYPMAKEDGSLSRHFNVAGIPAAAVVKDGEIVWRGHPNRLTDEALRDWL